jgi:hypothetical protein
MAEPSTGQQPRLPRSASDLRATFLVLLAGAFASATYAEIAKIVIDRRTPVEAVGISGSRIKYEEIRGRLFGEVDPRRAENAIIQDLEAAPQNARGKVEYISTFTLLHPIDGIDDSGVLLAPIPNRGQRGIAAQRYERLMASVYYDRHYDIVDRLASRPSREAERRCVGYESGDGVDAGAESSAP